MQKISIMLVLIIALCAVHPHEAYAVYGCPPAREIPVNIMPRFDNPIYDFDHDIASIQAIAEQTSHGFHDKITMGFTKYRPFIEVSMPMKGMQLSDGTVCGQIDSVDITFGYSDVMVFIAREVPQGSCAFHEIAAHEQKHINVNLRVLRDYLPRIRTQIEGYVIAHGVWGRGKQEDIVADVELKVQKIVNDQMAQLERESQALQAQVDTPEEYRRITHACNGAVADLAMRHMYIKP